MRSRWHPSDLWWRIRNADAIDWMFAILFGLIGIFLALLAAEHLWGSEDKWGALSFTEPAHVASQTGDPLRAPGLPSPAIDIDPNSEYQLTVTVERFLDCAVYECPSDEIELLVDVTWNRIGFDGIIEDVVIQVEDLATSIQQDGFAGVNYTPGKLAKKDVPFNVSIPPQVLQYVATNGTSAWTISGSVRPTLPGAIPAFWQTEAIHLRPGST